MSNPRPIPIPIHDAKTWTLTWQQKKNGYSNAFLIPIDDLLVCMEEMGVKVTTDSNGVISATPSGEHIRAYIGVDSKSEERLLLVGTYKPAGGINEDIVAGRTLSPGFKGNPLNGSSGAYDFTKPCPNECDPLSPLNHKIKLEDY